MDLSLDSGSSAFQPCDLGLTTEPQLGLFPSSSMPRAHEAARDCLAVPRAQCHPPNLWLRMLDACLEGAVKGSLSPAQSRERLRNAKLALLVAPLAPIQHGKQ